MTRRTPPRAAPPRARAWRVLAAAVALAVTPAAALPRDAQPAPSLAYVDPGLVSSVARGAAPAILSWDDAATSRAAVGAHLERIGVPHTVLPHLSMALVCAGSGADVHRLAAVPGAISVWGDEEMVPTLDGSVPTAYNGSPDAVWSGMGLTGKGVGIAVLDTGIDASHPDLEFGRKTVLNARVIVSHYEILGVGQDTCAPDSYDEDVEDSETVSGHGTHLASVAAGDGSASGGRLKGMAPGADLIGLSVVEQSTPQVDGDVQLSLVRFIAGVSYVLQRALDGGPTVAKVALLGWSSTGLWDPCHPHYLAVRDLHDFGLSVVVPTGNGGPGPSSCDQAETCAFNRLGVGGFSIAVGATPKQSRTELEPYSSRGDPVVRESRGETAVYEPTLVAPGTRVVAARRPGLVTYNPPLSTVYPLQGYGEGVGDDPTDLDYQALSGTSVSAAHVAGAVAVVQQGALERYGCFLTPRQVRQLLMDTASPLPGYARWEVGAGALDVTAAIEELEDVVPVTSPDPWMCPE